MAIISLIQPYAVDKLIEKKIGVIQSGESTSLELRPQERVKLGIHPKQIHSVRPQAHDLHIILQDNTHIFLKNFYLQEHLQFVLQDHATLWLAQMQPQAAGEYYLDYKKIKSLEEIYLTSSASTSSNWEIIDNQSIHHASLMCVESDQEKVAVEAVVASAKIPSDDLIQTVDKIVAVPSIQHYQLNLAIPIPIIKIAAANDINGIWLQGQADANSNLTFYQRTGEWLGETFCQDNGAFDVVLKTAFYGGVYAVSNKNGQQSAPSAVVDLVEMPFLEIEHFSETSIKGLATPNSILLIQNPQQQDIIRIDLAALQCNYSVWDDLSYFSLDLVNPLAQISHLIISVEKNGISSLKQHQFLGSAFDEESMNANIAELEPSSLKIKMNNDERFNHAQSSHIEMLNQSSNDPFYLHQTAQTVLDHFQVQEDKVSYYAWLPETHQMADRAGEIQGVVNEEGMIIVRNQFEEVIAELWIANPQQEWIEFNLSLASTHFVEGDYLSVSLRNQVGIEHVVTEIGADLRPPQAVHHLIMDEDGEHLYGYAEPNVEIIVRDAQQNIVNLYYSSSDKEGYFKVAFIEQLNDAEILFVSARDAAGNESQAIKISAPSRIMLRLDYFEIGHQGEISGWVETAGTLCIYNIEGTLIVSHQIENSKNETKQFSVQLTPAYILHGHELSVKFVHGLHQESQSFNVRINLTAPAAIRNVSLDDEGHWIFGISEPYSKIVLKDAKNQLINADQEYFADDIGYFSFELMDYFIDAEALFISAVNELGNESVITEIIAPQLNSLQPNEVAHTQNFFTDGWLDDKHAPSNLNQGTTLVRSRADLNNHLPSLNQVPTPLEQLLKNSNL